MAVLIAVLLVLVAASPAGAAGLKPLPPSSGTGTMTDGDRYAAYLRGGSVRILDEATRERERVEVPASCVHPALGGGSLAFWCHDDRSLRLYDIRSATWARVPDPDGWIQRLFGPEWSLPTLSLGRVWVRLDGGPDCYHCDTWIERLHRDTGEAGPQEPDSRRIYEDLDDPRLWLALCSPLRRKRNPHYDEVENSAERYWDPFVFGRRAVEFDGRDRPVLRRCGSARRRLLTRSPHVQLVQLGGGFLSWLDQDPASETARGFAVAYELATGRLRRWRIPGPANGNVYVRHTRRRLFVDKRGESGRASRRFSVMLRP